MMNWYQLTSQLTVWVLCALIVGTGAEEEKCSRDDDCRKPNTFCYESRSCANCTDCKKHGRYPGRDCAKDKHQCGDCLPGTKAEDNIDGSLVCLRIIASEPPVVSEEEDDNHTTVIIIVACVIIAVLGVVGCSFLIFKRFTNCNCSTSWQIIIRTCGSMCPTCLMNNRDCPPPYTEKNPTAPPYEEPIPPAPNLPIETTVYRHVENDPSQRANPCVSPNWVRGGSFSTNTTEPQEPTENDLLMDPSVVIHDEDTQPSTWSPTAQSTGPISFQNSITNLETLNISQPGQSPPRGTDAQSNTSRTSSTISINIPPNNAGNNNRNDNIGQQININLGVCLTNNNINR